ncbi:DUF1350 family protein [Anthocerotibacter panamensis]|uniref:DUF1350 family protein n=1 Tax=Anthocerotibacter panamensis TaxID=2857077 RepID=UPI001C4059FD|nr:DUF1350 family protein [Anthocerotibacter panamensis]
MEWQEVSGNWVLTPARPKGIVHFLGGAFVAVAPHITYQRLLAPLAAIGLAIIATPYLNTFDHGAVAQDVLERFEQAVLRLKMIHLPVYGLGHSMGVKLHLLLGSLLGVEYHGNLFLSYNNFSARRSVPLVDQFNTFLPLEFTPTPAQSNLLVQNRYLTEHNLLIRFTDDTLDETLMLAAILQRRCLQTTIRALEGNHLTPLGPEQSWPLLESLNPWQVGALPLASRMQQDLLIQEICSWLEEHTYP